MTGEAIVCRVALLANRANDCLVGAGRVNVTTSPHAVQLVCTPANEPGYAMTVAFTRPQLVELLRALVAASENLLQGADHAANR